MCACVCVCVCVCVRVRVFVTHIFLADFHNAFGNLCESVLGCTETSH